MKYFITGGAGFIGSHLVDRLIEKGDFVTAYDNLSFGKKEYLQHHFNNPKFKLIQGDILDLNALKPSVAGHDFIFHLAANSDIMRGMKDPALDFEMGVRATFNVLEAMRELSIKSLVYLSGSGVYGDYGEKILEESSGAVFPQSMYGAAKLASEGMVSAYSHLYEIQAWIFRPANIIGPRPTHGVIYDFIQKLKNNPRRLEVLGDGTQSKSYIHVEDLLDAVFFAIKHALDPVNTFNVASETVMDVRTIAEAVIQTMRLSGVVVHYGKENRGWKGDIPKVRLSIQKLKSLGWKPKFSSREAVVETIREILKNTVSGA